MWTDAMTAALKSDYENGLTAGVSAQRLSARFGVTVTRNAVIGKRSREKLSQTSARDGARSKPRSYAVAKAGSILRPQTDISSLRGAKIRNRDRDIVRTAPDIIISTPAPAGGVSLMDRGAKQCCRPIGEADVLGRHMFCGAPRKAGSSYCPSCHEACWKSVPASRKNPRMEKSA